MGGRGSVFLLTIGIIGLGAQFVDGALGMGYGVFSTTLLVAAGLAPVVASASVHTAEIATTLISGIAHSSLGNVDRKVLLPLVIPGVAGGILGALFLANLPTDAIKPWVAGILLVMGCVVVWRFIARNSVARSTGDRLMSHGSTAAASNVASISETGMSAWKLAFTGFVAAALDAFGGGGWGPITTPTLILGHNLQPHKVVGSINVAEFFVTLAISGTFFLTIGPENFDWAIVGCLLVAGIIAAPVAAWLCRKLAQRWLGILIGLLMIGTNLRTLVLSLS